MESLRHPYTLNAYLMKPQKGMTLISWLITLVIIAVFSIILIRIVPMYQEYYNVSQIMTKMEMELDSNQLTKQQVWTLLSNHLKHGGIKHVKKENVQINRGQNDNHMTKIVIDYEVRRTFVAQIDFIASFHSEIDVELVSGL